MFASELIKKMQDEIDERGEDLQVVFWSGYYYASVERIIPLNEESTYRDCKLIELGD